MPQSVSVGVPAVFIIAHFIVSRDKVDLEQGLLGNVDVSGVLSELSLLLFFSTVS